MNYEEEPNPVIAIMEPVNDKVEDVLASCKAARNCDKRLIWEVLTQYYDLKMPFEIFKQFPPFESVTRCRRKIQEEKRWLPTDLEVWLRRGFLEEEYKKYYSHRGERNLNFFGLR